MDIKQFILISATGICGGFFSSAFTDHLFIKIPKSLVSEATSVGVTDSFFGKSI